LTELPSNSIDRVKGRRWSVIAAGLLLAALALVVLYTSRPAFSSPVAMVVVAAIGFAALVLQLRLRKRSSVAVRTPLWLNMVALLFAVTAIFADVLHLSPVVMLASALGAVICFAVSGIVMLRALRKG
jgi:FtsH-binding integral membrane protein